MWNLQGKKALITGGTKGIGLAIAKEFLELGAEVLVVARDTQTIKGKVKNSANLFTMDGDVAEGAFRQALIQRIAQNWGKLDILVNNVGTNVRKKLVAYSEDEYRKLFEMEGIVMDFTDEALEYIVDQAMQYKLGARGLRSICETIVTDAMFELPSQENVRSFIVTADYAKEKFEKSVFYKMKTVA